MKKIIVPTDFSPNAGKALNFAVEIAKVAKASVLLVHVSDMVDIPFREKTALELKYNLPHDDCIQLELSNIQQDIETGKQFSIDTKLYAGHISTTIIQAAEENHADMIIMGTLGDAAFKEKLFGSITAAVIGKSTIPVLAVPILSEWDVPKHILMVVNHFEEDPAMAKPAIELAALFDAKVTVVVFTDKQTAVPADYLENARGIVSYEEKLKAAFNDINLEPDRLYGNDFVETLDEYIDENYIDILVMLTHKRNLAESLFHRSMTKKMSYHTNTPLLAIPVH
jgi:nucleotide-binding universal stress UspA family protein